MSGFYGLLRPMDGIVPYRLEMQAKIHMSGYKNLYDFWKDGIYRELTKDTQVILNLASKEYSKCIESYLGEKDRFITCIFAEEVSGKCVQKATMAKMARGRWYGIWRKSGLRIRKKPKDLNGWDLYFRQINQMKGNTYL